MQTCHKYVGSANKHNYVLKYCGGTVLWNCTISVEI